MKLPLWVFSYLLLESIVMFPQVLSSAQIRRRLQVSKSTSLLLKRRLQVFLNDLMPRVKELLVSEIRDAWDGVLLPESGDLSSIIKNKPVLSIDGLALFSATQRSNGGRARWKHTGQTASVFLTDAVALEKGKFQIGTLCHTTAVKGGPIILDAVRSFRQKDIEPLLSFLPVDAPVFSDDAYPWLSRYNPNHRSICHTARAKDRKRNVWARNRYCREGIHNNVAEGNGRVIKHSFIAGYSYVSPANAPLYLGEYAGLKAVRVYGLKKLAGGNAPSGNIHSRIKGLQYSPPKIGSRVLDLSNARRQIRGNLKTLLEQNEFFEARQAHLDYLNFWQDAPLYRKQLEKEYGAVASELWRILPFNDGMLLTRASAKLKFSHRLVLRIVKRWVKLGLARASERPGKRIRHVWAGRRTTLLPPILYSFDMEQYKDQDTGFEVQKPERRGSSKYGLTRERRKQFMEVIK